VIKKYTYLFLFAVFFSLTGSATLPDSLINIIDFETAENQNIQISNGKRENKFKFADPKWLFITNDHAELKFGNQNESNYKIVNSHSGVITIGEKDKGIFDAGFNGIAWYKCYFKIPQHQINKVYGLEIALHGAVEIYLDGKFQKAIGTISQDGKTVQELNVTDGSIYFPINDSLVHCIAIRFALPNYSHYLSNYADNLQEPAFEFSVSDLKDDSQTLLSIYYSVTNMLSAFFFALFIIHLLIYFFYRDQSFNLLYAMFLFLLSLTFLEAYLLRFIEDLKFYLWLDSFDNVIFPTVCFILVTILNKLLDEKRTWHYIALCIALVYHYVDVIFIHEFHRFTGVSIIFYTYFNTLAHSIKGVRRKIVSAKFLGWGILGFTLSFILLILSTVIISMISVKANGEPAALFTYAFFIILGILSIPLSMTAYLAYDFAGTNKSLKLKLIENQELNAKSLQQEKEKQELLENQNRTLEIQVSERTKEIANQNKLLEHQKKEITDSITYAKRIQQALLPELSEIKAKLPNSFILYLPKDIVSGDFYYFQTFNGGAEHPGRQQQINETGTYIAAADCTGHGVPGALMSMIVHEKIEAATKIFNQPKDILTSINKQVKDALKQYQNENASRDGCDIAFLKLCEDKLYYSGAYRPLYIFDKENNFNEIKATKTAIAGLTPYDQEFEQHEFDVKTLKAVYAFSDGFADQFGGEKTKKLTTKKFKELLSKIVDLPIDEQKEQLDRFFTQWKGNVEQIDDVLVIGIRF